MRVLLDENMPQRFRRLLPNHGVVTAAYMGWEGKENGDLLKAMKAEGFQALVTFDKALVKQQNLQDAGVGVVVVCIHPVGYQILAKLAPEIGRVLEFLRPGQIVSVPEKPA
jgi:predicted nuclease of predicted toxin-antitoxin system